MTKLCSCGSCEDAMERAFGMWAKMIDDHECGNFQMAVAHGLLHLVTGSFGDDYSALLQGKGEHLFVAMLKVAREVPGYSEKASDDMSDTLHSLNMANRALDYKDKVYAQRRKDQDASDKDAPLDVDIGELIHRARNRKDDGTDKGPAD